MALFTKTPLDSMVSLTEKPLESYTRGGSEGDGGGSGGGGTHSGDTQGGVLIVIPKEVYA